MVLFLVACATAGRIPFKTGNLSVKYLMALVKEEMLSRCFIEALGMI